MNPNPLGKARDPNLPDWAYTAKPLVDAYEMTPDKKKKKIATLFLGEWTKILDKDIPTAGPVKVKFRGGEGYVDAENLSRNRFLEIFFIDVDQGDSILIQTPDDRRILIDGGQTGEAFDFIKNKYRLDKKNNFIDFEAVVATHSDADHTQGLINILKHPKIAVKRFYHNGLFRRIDKSQDPGAVSGGRIFGLEDDPGVPGKPELTPLMKKIVDAAQTAGKNLEGVIQKMKENDRWKGRIEGPEDGFIFKRLDAAEKFLPPFTEAHKTVTIDVLWPRAEEAGGKRSYPFYENASKTVNGNSIVLVIRHGRFKILLTGDLNARSMADLLSVYGGEAGVARGEVGTEPTVSRLGADIYKAAHHGSQDFDVDFLKAVSPNAAVISSGDDRNDIHGHPRAVLLGTITRYSKIEKPAVFCTELAACFTRLSPKERKQFREEKVPLYERSIKGIVHLRSDGQQLYLGTVHGRKAPEDPQANILWKWDIWPTP
jgi:beta-lactamase superfamily II metal-dependent hydrolase